MKGIYKNNLQLYPKYSDFFFPFLGISDFAWI